MTTRTVRKIVKIDEEKCDGCGLCVPSCVEGALQIVDGKARLISEVYCDGLGACLGECPQDAITIEEREAEDFSEEAVKETQPIEKPARAGSQPGCPSARMTTFGRLQSAAVAAEDRAFQPSQLGHWPIQLTLVPPRAPFLQGSDLVLAADCVPFACGSFHRDFLKGHSLLIACPKLDDLNAHYEKLTEILRQSDISSLTVIHMEVPCCSNLAAMAGQAAIRAGKPDIPIKYVNIGLQGEVKSEK